MERFGGLLVLVAVAGAGVGAWWWLQQPLVESPATHVGCLLDASDSMDPGEECQAPAALLGADLASGALDDRSQLFLWLTGTPETALEPIRIASGSPPWSGAVLEGVDANRTARSSWLAGWIAACQEDRQASKVSPIYLAIQRAVSQLRGLGCIPESRCKLYVQSDLEDTEQPWIRASLKAEKVGKLRRPEPIDNQGIRIVLCGYAQTRGETGSGKSKRTLTSRRSKVSPDTLTRVWREVFTAPDQVTFLPFCPRDTVVAKTPPPAADLVTGSLPRNFRSVNP